MKFSELFKRIVIIDYILIILFVILTGILGNLINPRQNIFVYICLGVFCLFIINKYLINNKKLIKEKNHENEDSCDCDHHEHNHKLSISDVIYLLPIVLVLFINGGKLSASTINNRINTNISVSKTNNSGSSNASQTYYGDNTSDFNADSSTGIDINVSDKNYVDDLDEISNNIDKYVGKTIKVKGFIYRKQDLSSNQFILSRLYMYCCVADTQLIGYLTNYDKVDTLGDDTWYEVTAKIEKAKVDGDTVPQLNIVNINQIDKPGEQYVY